MKDHNSRRLANMGRRRFMYTLLGLGISGVTVSVMSQEALADLTDDPTEEVPRLERLKPKEGVSRINPLSEDDMEAEFYTISRDEYVRVESASDAAARVNERLESLTDSNLITAGVATENHPDYNRRTVIVTRTSIVDGEGKTLVESDSSLDALSDELPDTQRGVAGEEEILGEVEDIPVEVVEVEETLLNECGEKDDELYYDYSYRDPGVPSGARLDNCTTLMSGYYDDEPAVYTAAHCFVDEGDEKSDGIGESGYQPRSTLSTFKIGEVTDLAYHDLNDTDDDWPMDIAVIEMDGEDPTQEVASDEGSDETIGQIYQTYAWDAIKDNANPIFKQGRTTGRCDGQVTSYWENNHRHYDMDATVTGGDSGGPQFTMDDDEESPQAMAGVTRAVNNNTDDTRAIYIGDIYSEFPISFVQP